MFCRTELALSSSLHPQSSLWTRTLSYHSLVVKVLWHSRSLPKNSCANAQTIKAFDRPNVASLQVTGLSSLSCSVPLVKSARRFFVFVSVPLCRLQRWLSSLLGVAQKALPHPAKAAGPLHYLKANVRLLSSLSSSAQAFSLRHKSLLYRIHPTLSNSLSSFGIYFHRWFRCPTALESRLHFRSGTRVLLYYTQSLTVKSDLLFLTWRSAFADFLRGAFGAPSLAFVCEQDGAL